MFCTLIALVSVPLAYFSKQIIEHLYPEKLNAYVAYYGWYVLEFCSRVELKAQNTYALIKQYLPATMRKKEYSFITLVKEGEEVKRYELSEFMKLKEENHIVKGTYDFILYELPITDNDKYNNYIVRYNDHNDIMEIEYNAFNEFNFNVMQFKFKDVDVTYNINFNKNQFMVDGNILFDRAFLKWYLNKYNNANVKDDDKYTIAFIDQAMNYTILTENDYIVIKNKSYEVISIRKIDDEEGEKEVDIISAAITQI